MNWLSNQAVARLRATIEAPDLSGTPYEVIEEIGRGGMGTVHSAHDRRLDRIVALKILATSAAKNRMEREARILARLEHPGIIPIHDTGTLADGRSFYVMKLVRGERLDKYLSRSNSVTDRLRIFLRICEPVAFAHSNGIVHRDLKPQNIMIGPFGELLVLDWGAAKVMDAAEIAPSSEDACAGTSHGTVIGTEGYMAPEQASGAVGAVDHRSDIYALGRLLRQIAGRNTSRALIAICAKATAEVPDERYGSMGELASDVSKYLDGEPVTAYKENVFEQVQRWMGRNKTVLSLILAYLLMRALLFFWRGV